MECKAIIQQLLAQYALARWLTDVQTVDWINCEDPSDATIQGSYAKPLTSYGIKKELQKHLAAIRTDLDSFNDTEAAALMTSGYLMVSNEFNKCITNFQVSSEKSDWWFLAIADDLKNENVSPSILNMLKVAEWRYR